MAEALAINATRNLILREQFVAALDESGQKEHEPGLAEFIDRVRARTRA